jgi:hypothetical protein
LLRLDTRPPHLREWVLDKEPTLPHRAHHLIVSVSHPLHPFPPLWQRTPLCTQHRAVPFLPASHYMLTHTIGTFPARLVFIGLEHYAWRRPPPARLHLHPYAVSKHHSHAAKRRATPSTRLSPSSSPHCRLPFHRRRPRPPPHTTARIGYTLRSTAHAHPRCTTPRRYRPRRRCPCYTLCRRPHALRLLHPLRRSLPPRSRFAPSVTPCATGEHGRRRRRDASEAVVRCDALGGGVGTTRRRAQNGSRRPHPYLRARRTPCCISASRMSRSPSRASSLPLRLLRRE